MAQNETQRRELWAARRVVSTALRQLRRFKISEDIAVPRSKIPEAVERIKALGDKYDLLVATYGHAGDGNLHANILYAGPEERPRVDRALAELMAITIELGGTITGEHGVGIAKRRSRRDKPPIGKITTSRVRTPTRDETAACPSSCSMTLANKPNK